MLILPTSSVAIGKAERRHTCLKSIKCISQIKYLIQRGSVPIIHLDLKRWNAIEIYSSHGHRVSKATGIE